MRQGFFKTLHVLLLFLLASVQGQDVSDLAGNWTGYIDVNGRELSINLTFSYSDGILDGTIDIPEQDAYTLPVEVKDTSDDRWVFQFETGSGPAVFNGNRNADNDKISGEFKQFGDTHEFLLRRNSLTDRASSDLPETNIIIPSGTREIGGSLILREERSPLVILVSGSGSQDRDMNIGGFRVFRHFSARLYDEGHSSFRYDDRGIGESTGDSDATLREMADDLSEVIEYLRLKYSGHISGVVLLGHNQGGLVASMAVAENSADGVILAAAPFLHGEEVITGQIEKISEMRGISDEIVKQNLEFQQKVYDVIRTGTDWEAIEKELADRLEQQIQQLPSEHQNALGDMSGFIQSQVDRQLETAKSRWFKSWIETEPVDVIKQLEIPILAVLGEKDTQVLPASNKKKADSLASEMNVDFRITTIAGANHLFQQAKSGMPEEYGMLDHEFIDGFMSEIDQFLDSLQMRVSE